MDDKPNNKPDLHHRRSIRLQGFDYSQPGAYFITMCAHNRECLFGDIIHEKMILNDAGIMTQTIWGEMPFHYKGIEIDEFVIMPNHVHGIVVINNVGAGPRACPDSTTYGCLDATNGHHILNTCGGSMNGEKIGQAKGLGQPQGVAPTGRLSLFDVVYRLKTMTTKRYIDAVKQLGWRSFQGKLWQRNYYEHIIRNDVELNGIREYIINNPLNWALDRDNPLIAGKGA
jgi:putative transposase